MPPKGSCKKVVVADAQPAPKSPPKRITRKCQGSVIASAVNKKVRAEEEEEDDGEDGDDIPPIKSRFGGKSMKKEAVQPLKKAEAQSRYFID